MSNKFQEAHRQHLIKPEPKQMDELDWWRLMFKRMKEPDNEPIMMDDEDRNKLATAFLKVIGRR